MTRALRLQEALHEPRGSRLITSADPPAGRTRAPSAGAGAGSGAWPWLPRATARGRWPWPFEWQGLDGSRRTSLAAGVGARGGRGRRRARARPAPGLRRRPGARGVDGRSTWRAPPASSVARSRQRTVRPRNRRPRRTGTPSAASAARRGAAAGRPGRPRLVDGHARAWSRSPRMRPTRPLRTRARADLDEDPRAGLVHRLDLARRTRPAGPGARRAARRSPRDRRGTAAAVVFEKTGHARRRRSASRAAARRAARCAGATSGEWKAQATGSRRARRPLAGAPSDRRARSPAARARDDGLPRRVEVGDDDVAGRPAAPRAPRARRRWPPSCPASSPALLADERARAPRTGAAGRPRRSAPAAAQRDELAVAVAGRPSSGSTPERAQQPEVGECRRRPSAGCATSVSRQLGLRARFRPRA